jgi:hypothetical protein
MHSGKPVSRPSAFRVRVWTCFPDVSELGIGDPCLCPLVVCFNVLTRDLSIYYGLARPLLGMLHEALALKEGITDVLLDMSFLGARYFGNCEKHLEAKQVSRS